MIKALIGNSGHAKEVLAQIGDTTIKRFVDDQYWDNTDPAVIPLSKFNPAEYEILIAVGDSSNRRSIAQRLPLTTKYFTFIHPTALILSTDITIGEGSFIGAYSILTANIKLGNHTLLNRSNHIGHDTNCGDYLSMMPGSIISGNVNIGECVYIGSNATIREKINICDNVILGLNSGVVKDIKTPGRYIGTPVKKL